MPRYFFNLYNDLTAIDEEGVELPDLAAPEVHGIGEARYMAAMSVKEGRIDFNHRIDIADESGAVLKTVRFADAVRVVGQSRLSG